MAQLVGPGIIALALALVSASPALAAEPADEDRACYDVAVVGRLLHASNFVDLNDVLPPPSPEKPDMVWFAGRLDLLVRVEVASGGKSLSSPMRLQAIMADLPMRNSALLFYVQRLPDGRWFAVDWDWAKQDWLGRYKTHADDAPPRCTSGRKRVTAGQAPGSPQS